MNSTVVWTTCSPISSPCFPRSEAVPCSPPQMLWNVVWIPVWQSGSEAESGTSLPGQPCSTRLPIRHCPPGSLTPRRRTILIRWKSLGTKRSVATIPYVVNFFFNSFELFTYLLNFFIWGPQILVVAHGLSSCGSWALLLHSMWNFSSLTRD